MRKGWYPVIDYEKCVGCPNVPCQYAENWRQRRVWHNFI